MNIVFLEGLPNFQVTTPIEPELLVWARWLFASWAGRVGYDSWFARLSQMGLAHEAPRLGNRVVWNMNFISPYIGNFIIPTDFHIFQMAWNHQPE